MSTAQEILDHARTLFDIAGAAKLENGQSVLILGLESTPERNL